MADENCYEILVRRTAPWYASPPTYSTYSGASLMPRSTKGACSSSSTPACHWVPLAHLDHWGDYQACEVPWARVVRHPRRDYRLGAR